MDKSIGIIGGADGPTSIFIAGSSNLWIWGLGLLLLAVAGWFLFRRR